MAFGAPPELLAQTQRAARDEIVHARQAFALASAYAGISVGPGRLRPPGRIVWTSDSLADVAEDSIRDGCIGETVAVLVAAERLRHATDPAVAAALRRVVIDESRHADLGWSIVEWACAVGGDAVRNRVRSALAKAESRMPSFAELPEVVPGAEGHGMVAAHDIRRAVQRGLVEVLHPVVAAFAA